MLINYLKRRCTTSRSHKSEPFSKSEGGIDLTTGVAFAYFGIDHETTPTPSPLIELSESRCKHLPSITSAMFMRYRGNVNGRGSSVNKPRWTDCRTFAFAAVGRPWPILSRCFAWLDDTHQQANHCSLRAGRV